MYASCKGWDIHRLHLIHAISAKIWLMILILAIFTKITGIPMENTVPETFSMGIVFIMKSDRPNLLSNRLSRRVAEFHMRLTFWENLPHRHKGWNRSQIKTKCFYFNFDWVVRTKIGSVISKKGEITLSLQKRELWSTNFESIFCSVKTLFFGKLFYFLKSI